MNPIVAGDRGPAVEDVQRRLRLLGYDLGPTGVDGVFLGATLAAIEQFQADRGLAPDGAVGEKTWAALVDATFTLGDRMLYLRVPHLHGCDVRALQQVLGALGFSPGDADGIFGPSTERAVRDFQQNTGLGSDGIVGPDTVRALDGLRHLWEGRDAPCPADSRIGPARATEALSSTTIAILPEDPASEELAARVHNLATATTDDSRVGLLAIGESPDPGTGLVVRLAVGGTRRAAVGKSVVTLAGTNDPTLATRFRLAWESQSASPAQIIVDLSRVELGDERVDQQVAVSVVDALCAALG